MLLTAKSVVLPINLCYHNCELNNRGMKMIKLSERMYLNRTDRPDEWSMDDYARENKAYQPKSIQVRFL